MFVLQEVFVRDCVVVKSGKKKQDKPFLAKIASIWQETGSYSVFDKVLFSDLYSGSIVYHI